MRNITVLLVMLYAFTGSIAQNSISETKLSFSKQEVFNDYKIVYFVIDKLITENDIKKIMYEMIRDGVIIDMWIENNTYCKVKIKLDTKPEDIQTYLHKLGYNFTFELVQKSDNTIKNINQNMLPVHYPEKIKADGKEIDEASFQKAVEFWKKRYPNEWEEFKKNENNIK